MNSIISTPDQMGLICKAVKTCLRLPLFDRGANVPGALLEMVIGEVRGARPLGTYDFVDVVKSEARIGWQIKSTKADTPVTWKRAKIPNRDEMIRRSERSKEGLQALGDAILEFCNQHARESLEKYQLDSIGLCRLVRSDKTLFYYERELCSRRSDNIFSPAEFSWGWSKAKETKVKEQLSALHGTHRKTGRKWFAWHGRGENQLHFSGESCWWPKPGDKTRVDFAAPSQGQVLSLTELAELLDG